VRAFSSALPGGGPHCPRLARYARQWRRHRPRKPRSQPYIEQLFLGRPQGFDEDAFERLLYRVRRRTENESPPPTSRTRRLLRPLLLLSTIIYKLMLAPQIEKFYFELANPLVTSALALITSASPPHFPSWKLAIPTLHRAQRGNQHHPRQHQLDECAPVVLRSPLFNDKIDQLYPVIVPAAATRRRSTTPSNSFISPAVPASRHAMLIPEAWAGNPT